MNFSWLAFRDHWLLRPDSIVGDVRKTELDTYMIDLNQNAKKTTINIAKALVVIIDEILTNATDRQEYGLKSIHISFDIEYGDIMVRDDGGGFEVAKYKDTDKWIPTIALTEEKSGTNFDDDKQRQGAGRNGYGAKATNVFSKKMTLETLDPERHLLFQQSWVDNMSTGTEPKIKKCAKKIGYTEIRFLPDYERFGMSISDKKDMEVVKNLLYSRAFDIIATIGSKISVYFNDSKLPTTNFQDYAKMFSENSWALDNVTEQQWSMRVAVTFASHDDEKNAGIHAMVNCLRCPRGTHIEWIYRNLKNAINSFYVKTKKIEKLTITDVKSIFFIILVLEMPNPSYASATKEELTSTSKEYGIEWKPSNSFMKNLDKNGLRILMEEKIRQKELGALKSLGSLKNVKSKGKMIMSEKYDPATGRGKDPKTLILTEGDSAKVLAVAGLSVVGRERYGIFPLRGKLLNPHGKSTKQISENVEIKTIIQILGLRPGNTTQTVSDLNYQKILLFTDSDCDGAHICSLVINMIHYLFPHILRDCPTFLQRFATPIIKVWNSQGVEKSFFSLAEKNAWQNSLDNKKYEWKERYYKGLGTSTTREAKLYFHKLNDHIIDLQYEGEETDNILNIMFAKSESDKRKEFLEMNYDPKASVDYSKSVISVTNYILQELLHFSWDDNVRSIPHIVDGLKPSERKILYTCLVKNITYDVKVSELSGIASAFSQYHHGEVSLQNTIVGMAQNHIGSNNINLLVPQGQHGSRLNKSTEHASPRYLLTRLSFITRKIFHEDDMPILTHAVEDGKETEPVFFVPVIPMLLVNGACGIGTGWSTSIPGHNPFEIIELLKNYINHQDIICEDSSKTLIPWVEGFTGSIERIGTKYVAYGKWEVDIDKSTIHITELPPGTWTDPYISKLQDLAKGSNPLICEIMNKSTESFVDITILCNSELFPEVKDIIKQFYLSSDIPMGNMRAFCSIDENNEKIVPVKFEKVEEIIEKFIPVRLQYYTKRKEYLLKKLSNDALLLKNRVRFIREVIDGTLPIIKMKKTSLIESLQSKNYHNTAYSTNDSNGYDYLLSMHIVSFTKDLVLQLNEKYEKTLFHIEEINNTTEKDFWRKDLIELEDALKKFYDQRVEERQFSLCDENVPVKKFRKRKPKVVQQSCELTNISPKKQKIK